MVRKRLWRLEFEFWSQDSILHYLVIRSWSVYQKTNSEGIILLITISPKMTSLKVSAPKPSSMIELFVEWPICQITDL